MTTNNRPIPECKHAFYCKPPEGFDYDIHLVKLQLHHEDGTTTPQLRVLKDYKRDIWVSKQEYREYKQKREKESIQRLEHYKVPQWEVTEKIGQALNMSWALANNPRLIRNSPYVYGTDISSTAILKWKINDKYKKFSYNSIAVTDIETDVLYGTDTIWMQTLSFKDRVYTVIRKDFFGSMPNYLEKLHQKFDQYLSEYKEKRNIRWEVDIVENEHEIVEKILAKAHDWKPDFITLWNMDFDIPVMIKALEKAKIDPANVFNAPEIPKPFRRFKYIQGPRTETTASGVVKNLSNEEQWHWVDSPASFIFIDAMCVYNQLRLAKEKEPSYSLDSILQKELGIRKLKFTEADHIPSNSIEWHKFLQRDYKLEYIVYNVFDCICVEELDEKTMDLRMSAPMLSGCSDYSYLPSQPRRVVDKLHWFLLERGYVIGTSGNLKQDIDDLLVPLKGWIVTLPAFMLRKARYHFIEESAQLEHSIHINVVDADVSASYPKGTVAFNISRETTSKELVEIEGLPYDEVVRHETINLSGGVTNAVAFVNRLFKAPNLFTLDEAFTKHLNNQNT